MKLNYSQTSPFVRKVLVAAKELGLDDKIERVATDAWAADTDLQATNPIGKVPALVTDEGLTLIDSKLIAEFLDAEAGGGKILPAEGRARFQALSDAMVADGVIEASVATLIEKMRRPEDKVWDGWVERQQGKIQAGLDHLEHRAKDGALDGAVDIAQITLACACGYLDFRFPDMDWRARCPKIAAWYETFNERQSMTTTRPDA